MKLKAKLLTNYLPYVFSICLPWQYYSGDEFRGYCRTFEGYGEGETLGSIINRLMPYIFAFSGLILLFMIIFSGYQLLTSAGNPEAMQKGKSRLTAALVGFILIFAAFWIYQLIGVIIGYNFTATT
jgi:hypothetical protein